MIRIISLRIILGVGRLSKFCLHPGVPAFRCSQPQSFNMFNVDQLYSSISNVETFKCLNGTLKHMLALVHHSHANIIYQSN